MEKNTIINLDWYVRITYIKEIRFQKWAQKTHRKKNKLKRKSLKNLLPEIIDFIRQTGIVFMAEWLCGECFMDKIGFFCAGHVRLKSISRPIL